MSRLIMVLLLSIASCLSAQDYTLETLHISSLDDTLNFQRSIYAIDVRFTNEDTLLWGEKIDHIQITLIDSVSRHELICNIQVEPGFTHFGQHQLVVVDLSSKIKLRARIDIRYTQNAIIHAVDLYRYNTVYHDTISISATGNTVVSMVIKGKGLFENSKIEFEDPHIHVLDDPSWRMTYPPDSIKVGVEFNGEKVTVGPKRFRVRNEFAMEGFGEIFIQSDRGPVVYEKIPNFVADGSEKTFNLKGDNFYPDIQAALLPEDGFADAFYLDRKNIRVTIQVPILDNSKSYRLALKNPDGKVDTTQYFTARVMPLSKARVKSVEHGTIFKDTKQRVAFTVETFANRKLLPNRGYEINIEGDRYPVLNVIDDSTCEALIKVPEKSQETLINQHIFTINQVEEPARWKGVLYSESPPEIMYLSENRILHSVDTLLIVIKGEHLEDATLSIEDPDVTFKILENRGDFLRAEAIAGSNVTFGSYPLVIRTSGVPFRFEDYRIKIQPWQPFYEYVGIEVASLGFLNPNKLWQNSGILLPIEVNDAITVKIFTRKIREELGDQSLIISGVLVDSTNTIRAEAFDKKMLELSRGTDVINWRWRVREKMKSGDRVEVTLMNPGNQNRVVQLFYVKKHWSEAFHGSTSFILFKIPFSGGDTRTEILKSVGIGITYQPSNVRNFIAFDGSFIIGNVGSNNDNLSVQVGLGLSAILWSHLQVGVGTNLTGETFQQSFMFVGTRFKIPIPLR